jgi:TfoX/Sxy family transcriptional regulator of competence genes
MARQTELETLAVRIASAMPPRTTTQQRMFGGVAFFVNGNMLCCASRRGLMVRVGAAAEERALASPHARPCRTTGRPMPGFISIAEEGFASDPDLVAWLSMARAYVAALPPKEKGGTRNVKSSSRTTGGDGRMKRRQTRIKSAKP